jgi:CheY-like chemotaxis protein
MLKERGPMKKRILILDDDRDFAGVVADRCRDMGLDVDIAECTTDATIRVNLNCPDLICVDVDPGMNDSLTFCEYLDWNPESRHVPLVILTEEENIADIRRCCSNEAAFVSKSGDCWALLQTKIAGILGADEMVCL